jgi:hypothetical protein
MLFKIKVTSRLKITPFQLLLISGSINTIIALTLRWWQWDGTPPMYWLINVDLWKAALDLNPNWIFNLLLFIPASYFLGRFLKLSFQSLVFLIFLSFSIETIQGILEWGLSDPADWVANSIGSLIGITIGARSNSK